MFGIRSTLKIGSGIFGISAIFILLFPKKFLELLNCDSSNVQLSWSMQMIGITLVALSGNMFVHSNNSDVRKVRAVGRIMMISATGLGILTLAIPVKLKWFSILYSVIGFSFGLNYLVCLLRKKN